MTTQKLTLDYIHRALGAKIVPFAGFDMPVRYSSDIEEHKAVRESVGVFDVSHMGEFLVKGEGALALLQKVTSNDVSKLTDGKVQYTCLPNTTGGIVDDLLIYRIDEQTYYLVVNASNIEKDWNWIYQYKDTVEGHVFMENLSDKTSLFAVQGPKATAVLQRLTDVNLLEMEYYSFKIGVFAGIENVIISATGYTGAGGFEIYVNNADAETVWNKIFEAGQPENIKPIGLGARDTLRLEMGYCLYGNDINDETSPIEAGLGWITKFTKEFTNSAALKVQKEKGVSKKLVGFKLIDKGIPRGHYPITDAVGNKIGEVTSGTISPMLGIGIGLGYVATDYSKEGAEIFVEIRGKLSKAQVCKLPFVKPTL
jgi:aminomethyltransferase